MELWYAGLVTERAGGEAIAGCGTGWQNNEGEDGGKKRQVVHVYPVCSSGHLGMGNEETG